MARTKISEFSATPGNNTDIDGINIAEGCAPSGINDAIRELMSQLKDFQAGTAGDSFNGPVGTSTAAAGAFTTLSASSTVSGTGFSNYLASPPAIGGTAAAAGAFTTLSASSTVSGTGFSTYLASPPAIGGTTAAAGSFTTLSASSTVTLSGGTANGVLYLNGSKVATSGSALTFDGTTFNNTAGPIRTSDELSALGGRLALYRAAGASYFDWASGQALVWRTVTSVGGSGASEAMRLDSTGLGIGTSSPTYKLDVNGLVGVGTKTASAGAGGNVRYRDDTGTFRWAAGILGSAAETAFGWYDAIAATERMRLDSSGNLGLGVTPSAWGTNFTAFQLKNGSAIWNPYNNTGVVVSANTYYTNDYKYIDSAYASAYRQINSQHQWYVAPSGTAGNAITFTQAMTLDASGRLAIGLTTSTNPLTVAGTSNASYTSAKGIVVNYGSSSTSVVIPIGFSWSSSISTQDPYWGIGFLPQNYSAGSGDLGFYTDGSERARINSSGNLLVGTTSAGAGAILDVQSTTKGVRFPNMTTTQKNAITPAAGTVVFDTTLAKLCVYSGSAWQTITSV